MENLIPAYILQVFVFGGAGYILNMMPKDTSMHVSWRQIGLLCLPGLGIIIGIYTFLRFCLR